MPNTDFRGIAARRLSEERELSPAIISLLSPDAAQKQTNIRQIPLDRIEPNPDQPRLMIDEEHLAELAASIREHGVLQPILVRPLEGGNYQLIAGERHWRASALARLSTIPAIVEEIDDETALEIAIIENLQREDLSPLDEALMYERMTRDHGYSVRKLAQKIGKDKGYIENRLRLADAPDDVKELVSLRKDTLSHAYELLKLDDERKRRRLAAQVARGELSLVRLREKIEGRRAAGESGSSSDGQQDAAASLESRVQSEADGDEEQAVQPLPDIREESLVHAKGSLTEALDELVELLRAPAILREIPDTDRTNLAKYLTIAKLKLENAITLVRLGDSGGRR